MLVVVLSGAWTPDSVPAGLVSRLDPRFEGALHSWLGSLLLGGCGLVLALVTLTSGHDNPFRRHWTVLAAGFFYLSADETIALHEPFAVVARTVFGASSPSQLWALVGAPAAVVVAMAYRPFLAHLPTTFRRRFLAAGAIYLGGAIGMELMGGLYEAAVGGDLVYLLLAVTEETLELAGVGLFLVALLDYLAALPALAAPHPMRALATAGRTGSRIRLAPVIESALPTAHARSA